MKGIEYFKTIVPSIALVLTNCLFAQDFNQVAKLVAKDRSSETRFGSPVAILNTTAMVGANYESYDSEGQNYLHYAGAVYVFNRQENSEWAQVQKIVAPDREANDFFGASISISGNYAIIGALFEDHDASGGNEVLNSGSAYIYKRENGTWRFMQKLTSPVRAVEDYFGCSACILGNYAIIGAYGEDENELETATMDMAGAAYVFELSEGGSWDLVQKIVASDRQAYAVFGGDISIDSNAAIISALDETKDETGENPLRNAGAVYLFERDDGIWNQVQKIVASDRGAENRFGGSVSFSGGYAIVGASGNDTDANGDSTLPGSGSAYIFERDASGLLIQVKKITASDRKAGASYGTSVGIDNDIIIVNAYNEYLDFEGNDSLANAGAAYLIERIDRNWEEVQKITASDRDADDYFGSTAISGNYVIVGATLDDEDAFSSNTLTNAGAAYIFEKGGCISSQVPDPENILVNGDFGSCTIAPWSLYFHDYLGVSASDILVDGKWKIEINALAGEPQNWHVQALQELSASQIDRFETGTTYSVSFEATAGSDNRPCNVVLGQNENPYTSVMENFVLLGTEPETYSFDFVMNQKFAEMKFTFDIGAESSQVTFDNVRLIKKEVAKPDALTRPLPPELKIFPNPASEIIHVSGDPGSNMMICDISGKRVKTANITSPESELNISDLNPGIYSVSIYKKGVCWYQKLVISK
jgi:hypothetical protein